MPELVTKPTVVPSAGTKPKIIEELVGHLNTGDSALSIARMRSPSGWVEPGQRPDFDEFTLVLEGALRVESEDGTHLDVEAGQVVICRAGEWVRYSTPGADGASYIAVCLPAFSPARVNRDED